MNFIKNHQKTTIVVVVCLILIALAMVAIYRMFYPNSSKSVYGERLKDIPTVDQAVVEKVKEKIEDQSITSSVKTQIDGRIIKFIIDTKKDTAVKDSQNLTTIITDGFSLSILQNYDFEVYITQKESESAVEYPMIGYRSKDAEDFNFVVNKAGDTSEK